MAMGVYTCKVFYRLATAQLQLQQYKACIQSCEKGLLLDPGARQLQDLHVQASRLLRSNFLGSRHTDLRQAVHETTHAAVCQAGLQQQQKATIQQIKVQQQCNVADYLQDNRLHRQSFSHGSNTRCGLATQPSAREQQLACRMLDVEPGCPASTIRSAYLKKLVTTHPDKGGSTDSFQALQDAYQLLVSRAAAPETTAGLSEAT